MLESRTYIAKLGSTHPTQPSPYRCKRESTALQSLSSACCVGPVLKTRPWPQANGKNNTHLMICKIHLGRTRPTPVHRLGDSVLKGKQLEWTEICTYSRYFNTDLKSHNPFMEYKNPEGRTVISNQQRVLWIKKTRWAWFVGLIQSTLIYSSIGEV